MVQGSDAGTHRVLPSTWQEDSGTAKPQSYVTGSTAHNRNASSRESRFLAGSPVSLDSNDCLLRFVPWDWHIGLAEELSFPCGFSKWLEGFRKQKR